jgi:hypothetical protein
MFAVLLAFTAVQRPLLAQVPASSLGGVPPLRVCCRPLPKWSSSRNPFLFALSKSIVSHLHHCYIDMGDVETLGDAGSSFQTSGIHPVVSDNDNKQPMPDQVTDTLVQGGECKKVEGATPDKISRLRDELAGGACNSCATDYHNRVISFCFNNSNTYVYDLISGAGMKPPKMGNAPGYRAHHACGRAEKQRSWKR